MATSNWEVFTTGRVLQYVTVGILENAGKFKANLAKSYADPERSYLCR